MYTDLLTQLKNAQAVKKEKIRLLYSKMDMAVAELLAGNKYVAEANKKGRLPKRIIEVKLRYDDNRGAITGFRFLSKPSRRTYAGYKELKPVRQGHGLGVISTPNGIMTTKEARKQKVGGQLLFEIW